MEESTDQASSTQFDGSVFVRGNLTPYGEEGRRLFAMLLMSRYVPSKLGEKLFTDLTQGRANRAAKTKAFFSTCGELGMMLLHHMGYRGPLLNRELRPDPDGVHRAYAYGQNMVYLSRRAQDHDNFVRFVPGETMPKPGDICYIVEPNGSREHVFVFREEIERDGQKIWVSYDAGQTFDQHAWSQCAKVRERTLDGRKVDSRVVVGWVDISTLELTQDAFLYADQRR